MTTPDIVFVDIETTGLDPDRHQLWELAAVHLDGRAVYGRWQVDLDGAEGRALAIGDYYHRAADMPRSRRSVRHVHALQPSTIDRWQVAGSAKGFGKSTLAGAIAREAKQLDERDETVVARDLAALTAGATIAGAAPHFDTRFLTRWLAERGHPAAWSHRLLDVCTYAAGAWGQIGPRSLADTLEHADIDHDGRAHTAMYDALQARRLWVQLADGAGLAPDCPPHYLVAERAGEHVKAWEHGLPLAPDAVPAPPARSTTPLTDRLAAAGEVDHG